MSNLVVKRMQCEVRAMKPAQLVDMRRRIREVILDKLLRGMTIEELKIVWSDVSKLLAGEKIEAIKDEMIRNEIDLDIDLTNIAM